MPNFSSGQQEPSRPWRSGRSEEILGTMDNVKLSEREQCADALPARPERGDRAAKCRTPKAQRFKLAEASINEVELTAYA